jgi:hypothetical protein
MHAVLLVLQSEGLHDTAVEEANKAAARGVLDCRLVVDWCWKHTSRHGMRTHGLLARRHCMCMALHRHNVR